MTTRGTALGRAASGGGETQAATPRILAAVPKQRQREARDGENEEPDGTTSANWRPGRLIEPGEVRRVHQTFSPHQRYGQGDIVAVIRKSATAASTFLLGRSPVEQIQYSFATVTMGYGDLGGCDDLTNQVLLYHGAMRPTTWELCTELRALRWDSRTPGDEIGAQDVELLRSHRRRQTMHFEGDLVGVAGRRQDGRQVLRYAKVCERSDNVEPNNAGLYQLDEGPLKPVSLRRGWEFFGMGRDSPTRVGVPASEIVEVPSQGLTQRAKPQPRADTPPVKEPKKSTAADL